MYDKMYNVSNLYLIKWTSLRGLTTAETNFIMDNFSKSETDNSYYIEAELLANAEQELTEEQRKEVADLIILLKDTMKKNNGSIDVAVW